jgi:hypothetical protein
VAGIEDATAVAIQSWEPEREEEKGGASSGRVRERPSHLVGLNPVVQRPDRWAGGPTGGPREGFNQKLTKKYKERKGGFVKTLLTLNK